MAGRRVVRAGVGRLVPFAVQYRDRREAERAVLDRRRFELRSALLRPPEGAIALYRPPGGARRPLRARLLPISAVQSESIFVSDGPAPERDEGADEPTWGQICR